MEDRERHVDMMSDGNFWLTVLAGVVGLILIFRDSKGG